MDSVNSFGKKQRMRTKEQGFNTMQKSLFSFFFFKKIGHYWRVYKQIIRFHISLLLEYRLNALIHSMYGFTFMLGVYFAITIAFRHTNTIGGFTQSEITFIYVTSLFIWTLIESICFEGYKRFMIEDVATGEFDKFLVKPLIPQVLVGMSRPHITSFIYVIVISIIFFMYGYPFFIAASIPQLLGFILMLLVGLLIVVNVLSTYATLAFFMTRSSQVIRTIQSVSDQSFYPTPIYPTFVQGILLTIIPSAYVAYIPNSILLGKVYTPYLVLAFVFLILLLAINRAAWHFGLQQYSSASS